MNKILVTSEFWMSIATILGSVLSNLGVIPEETWNKLVLPLLVYIAGRITSKLAKKATT